MKPELVYGALEALGLGRLDIQIYIFLGKNGPRKCVDLCQNLGLTKQQVYPSLGNLREKGAITVSVGHPAIFSAKPFEYVLGLLIQSKVREAKETEDSKEQILRVWQSILDRD